MHDDPAAGNGVAAKKAFEIAYALFRISGKAIHKGFCSRLEEQGLDLISAVSRRDREALQITTETIRQFMHLGSGVGLVHPETSELFLQAVGDLDSAILNEFGNDSAKLPNVDLTDIFSSTRENKIGEVIPSVKGDVSSAEDQIQITFDKKTLESGNSAKISEFGNSFHRLSAPPGETRKTVILEKIKQLGECRMKDIIEALPGMSERTLRYDLQNLVEQGIIERVGQSGPSTHYRLRNLSGAESFDYV